MTPKQKAALARGSKIRTLCGIYSQARSLLIQQVLRQGECEAITDAVDDALIRIRGESETMKRHREAADWR